MKFTYKLLSLGLAIACLSGCNAANTEIASSSAATATVTPTTDSTEVPASNNVFTSAGDGLYVTTDSGIYELQTVFPDSANIFYTDANTKERIFLCANPNCTHADESCPSYIATPSAMFPPMLLRVGDQLLVVFTETTDSSNPHGMLMNMDGSNRRTVFELASNQYMQGGFCTSGNDLYFDLYEINDSGNVTYQLWYVSFENGTSEKVMDLGSDSDHYSLCDGANNELCFNHVSSDGISYCMYNPQSKTISDPFFVDSSVSGNSMIQDGYLFVLDEQASSVQRIRLSYLLENDAIAAVIIGGTSFFGGKGNVLGTFTGVLLISVLRNGLNLLNVSSDMQTIFLGGIIIVAVFIDVVRGGGFKRVKSMKREKKAAA